MWSTKLPTGVAERLGIDYDNLKTLNRRIICCSASGYGQTGPYKDRPSFDNIIQAMGGLMSYNGEEGRPPVKIGAPIGDRMGGSSPSRASWLPCFSGRRPARAR
jgi:crotonobetainyl-CoA:carnitine CoA-transferase CaiB-like acyl-CoA transferase